MKRLMIVTLVVLPALIAAFADCGVCGPSGRAGPPQPDRDGFYALFNGRDLTGWKASENTECFKVAGGCIVANGKRSHLFYEGPVNKAAFKNFELVAEVMTFPKANSGIYFHTEYQDKGWPGKGYECQVNATHSDRKKTGGLYGIRDVMDTAPHKDNEWFTYTIKVQGKQITLKINDKVTCEYTEPDGASGGRKLSSGTIALQGHDPGSKVLYRSVKIKPLAD